MSAVRELRNGAAFLGGLRPFLRVGVDLAACEDRLERGLAEREQTFATTLERTVFRNPASPYRALLDWAGVGLEDVQAELRAHGLDATLERLHDAGVRVRLDEFKGLAPIERPGLSLRVGPEDFDNPTLGRHYEASTGGSSGRARPLNVQLDLLDHEAGYHALFYAAAGASERPVAVWHPAPPGAVGIKTALIQAKLGRPVERWFSQRRSGSGARRHALFTRATVAGAALNGGRIPAPEYTPAQHAGRVAAWLANQVRAGSPAVLATTPSGGVRACTAAAEGEADLDGTLFVFVGEPYTPAKAAVVEASGAQAAAHYAMAESGLIGLACLSPEATDDVHLVEDKVATILRPVPIGGNGRRVDGLFHTTLLPTSPKVMLNVESGDYGTASDRLCACGALPAAFSRHLHTIRSYEKLTSEGMSFLGVDVLSLVEQVLPARFGGTPTDYQLVEREEAGLTRVSLVVSPAVGPLDAGEAVLAVLEFWRSRGAGAGLMADVWAQGRTLEVVRREPAVTEGGKILALVARGERGSLPEAVSTGRFRRCAGRARAAAGGVASDA